MANKKKIWFFRYDTWQFSHVYLPMTWYEFKRYYELNGKNPDAWHWIEPVMDYDGWSLDEIVEEAVGHEADIYMFSSYMWSWEIVKVVANAIKHRLPNAILVLGGPHQRTTYTQPMLWFKDHPYFDATARPSDYGEFFITDMLDAISDNDLDWLKVRGSYSRRGYGPEGEKRSFKYPPDIIEAHIDHAKRLNQYTDDKGKLLGVMYETNRGCMYKCVYCEWGGGTNTKVIIKDMEHIKNDLSYLIDLKLHTLWITDANFGILKRDPELAEFLAERNQNLKFVGITGLAKTNSEKRRAVLEPLIKSGLVTLYQISLQTIDDNILKNIERTDVTPEENVNLARYFIDKYDIDVIVELILGLPGMKVETFYKETAIEYSLMNSVKPHTHHVPLYVLPDAPVGNPEYLEKYQIKLAPIAIEESATLLDDDNSKCLKLYWQQNYKKENTLHIPISSYSYTVEDWKEMFFMNDMNLVLMNMIMITPFIDLLFYHKHVPLDEIFKKIFLSLSSVKEFYEPVKTEYLDELADGKFWNKAWRQFEQGPVRGRWSVHSSYAYLWIANKQKIYRAINEQFADYIDDIVEDCLLYCKNSTISLEEDCVWENQWRWDDWEETGDKKALPVKESVELITVYQHIDWNSKQIYRNKFTHRKEGMQPIKMKLFQLSRTDDLH